MPRSRVYGFILIPWRKCKKAILVLFSVYICMALFRIKFDSSSISTGLNLYQDAFIKAQHIGTERASFELYMTRNEKAENKSRNENFGLYEEQIRGEHFDVVTWLETFDQKNYKNSVDDTLKEFVPIMPLRSQKYEKTYQNLSEVWHTFAEVCDRNNITYFLYSGAMVGAYRHHGLVPWDDDIDILVNTTQASVLKEAFKDFQHFVLFDSEKHSWKFHYRNSSAEYRLSWPFLEIFFFTENKTHVSPIHYTHTAYLKSDVFPLQRRPFLGDLYPVPCNMKAIMDKSFSLTDCESPHKSHSGKHRRNFTVILTPCDKLYEYFPFVERTDHGTNQIETLKLNGTVLSRMLTEAFC